MKSVTYRDWKEKTGKEKEVRLLRMPFYIVLTQPFYYFISLKNFFKWLNDGGRAKTKYKQKQMNLRVYQNSDIKIFN